jgi:formylglycine-generating enzyme required for sulfatase activity
MRIAAALLRALAVASLGYGAIMATPAGAQKPGDTFKDCDHCPKRVVVPAGGFMMGSPADEPGRNSQEGPQHRVTISREFAVGRFAVTFNEWDACVADGGCNGYHPEDEGWGRGRRPVINVSWDDAQSYLTWLSRKTGKTYRLLSEAEREYVTRAGTATPYWWGASISTDRANYAGELNEEFRSQTVPVDSFVPNPWGLYQVHGNVWEWVEDCFERNYAGAPLNGAAWTSGICAFRVLRGGSFSNPRQNLRAAGRYTYLAELKINYIGFRVARAL